MQACFAAVAVLLAGQVGEGRYEQEPPVAAMEPEAADARPMFQYTDETPEAAAPEASNPFRAETAPPRTPGAGGSYPDGAASPVTPTTDYAPGTAAVAVMKPRDLVRQLMQPPATGNQLQGQALELMDAVESVATRAEQTHVAEAYWELSAAVADYFLALQESAELQSLAASVANAGPAWQAATTKLELRTTAALRTAQAAQTRLRTLMGEAQTLPLPADLPHAGRYDSQYENIFGNRENAVAKQLNELLPVEYQNISNLAAAVSESADWLSLVSTRRSPDTAGEGLLRAHELLSLRRREFIDAVRHYNHHIAEYSELAIPGRVASERLVAMLIKTSATTGQPTLDPEVQAASAVEPEVAQQNAGGEAAPIYAVPPAYAAGSDPAAQEHFNAAGRERRVRRPILDFFRDREHSILRRPFARLRDDQQ